MAMFRARISFTGLRGFEIERLDRIMLRLGAGAGKITHAADSPGGDSPTSRMYLFPSVEVATVTEFIAWLQEQLQHKIQNPVELSAEKIDHEYGLPLAE